MAKEQQFDKEQFVQSLNIANAEVHNLLKLKKQYRETEQYQKDLEELAEIEKEIEEHGGRMDYDIPTSWKLATQFEKTYHYEPNPEKFPIFEKMINFLVAMTEFFDGVVWHNPLEHINDNESQIVYSASGTTTSIILLIPLISLEKKEAPDRNDDAFTLYGKRIYNMFFDILKYADAVDIDVGEDNKVSFTIHFKNVFITHGSTLSHKDKATLEKAIQRGEIDLSNNEEDDKK